MEEKKIIELAIKEAEKTSSMEIGGPFGAAVVTPDGRIFAASNTVLGDHDPTAHAEVNVIRKACAELGTHDLSGSILYTTCYPCPMCLGAIIWANIKEVHYGATPQDAASIGFRDDYIYDFIKGNCTDTKVLDISQICEPEACIKMFSDYAAADHTMY